MHSLRSRAFSFLAQHPRLRAGARRAYFGLWRQRAAFRARLAGRRPQPLRVIAVDPGRIRNAGIGWAWVPQAERSLRVLEGDWDLNVIPTDQLDAYQAAVGRYVRGQAWQDTGYYRDALDRLTTGVPLPGIERGEELRRRLEEYDRLFERLARKRPEDGSDRARGFLPPDAVRVRIGRSGDLILEEGSQFLAMARILGLASLPVLVSARHAGWHEFREQLLLYAFSEGGGTLYQPATHPDLADISATHDDRRFRLLEAHVGLASGTLLDIGANFGHFCHKFEERGFDCYAVERGVREYFFLRRLKIIEGKRFSAIQLDIGDFVEKTEFDVVLALNVFHHFLKTRREFEKLIRVLRRIRARVMFFEPHNPTETQMAGAYRNFDQAEFVRFVAEHGGYDRWEPIGYGEEQQRPIFKLTRDYGA